MFDRSIMRAILFMKAISSNRAMRDIAGTQERMLFIMLKDNIDTGFGNEHDFSHISSVEAYKNNVPLSDYSDYLPYIEEIQNGKANILTKDKVLLLEPTSGSTAATKLIPYNNSLKVQFQKGISAWLNDIMTKRGEAFSGSQYWQITPLGAKMEPTKVKIGFESDLDYLGFPEKLFIGRHLAVPFEVGAIVDMDSFRYATLLFLLKARDLSIFSVWHPSFLTLLIKPLNEWWPQLLKDIEEGTITFPLPIDAAIRQNLLKKMKKDKNRADELRKNGKVNIWPKLKLISCWGEAGAANYLKEINDVFPGVEVQPKGLLATEGLITYPVFGVGNVLSIESHFFEFVNLDGDQDITKLAHELDLGKRYSVVMTTGGGLYRYRLRDIVEVTGYHNRIPILRFIGKETAICDIFGEKLNDEHVSSVLYKVYEKHGINPSFSLVAPETDEKGITHYVLFISFQGKQISTIENMGGVEKDAEALLRGNYHYDYCRKLGQLDPLKVFVVKSPDPQKEYYSYAAEGRIGGVKPSYLSKKSGWAEIFKGDYLDDRVRINEKVKLTCK